MKEIRLEDIGDFENTLVDIQGLEILESSQELEITPTYDLLIGSPADICEWGFEHYDTNDNNIIYVEGSFGEGFVDKVKFVKWFNIATEYNYQEMVKEISDYDKR